MIIVAIIGTAIMFFLVGFYAGIVHSDNYWENYIMDNYWIKRDN